MRIILPHFDGELKKVRGPWPPWPPVSAAYASAYHSQRSMNVILTVGFLATSNAVTACQEMLFIACNFSCPRTDPDSETLQCISTSQLCDGSGLCSGGQDEGDNLAKLDCKRRCSLPVVEAAVLIVVASLC